VPLMSFSRQAGPECHPTRPFLSRMDVPVVFLVWRGYKSPCDFPPIESTQSRTPLGYIICQRVMYLILLRVRIDNSRSLKAIWWEIGQSCLIPYTCLGTSHSVGGAIPFGSLYNWQMASEHRCPVN